MKIRSKITLWITSAGILVSLVFSLIVFYEMVEQTYNQLDAELKATVQNVFQIVNKNEAENIDQTSLSAKTFIDSRHYWIRAFRDDTLVYSSRLTQIIDLPLNPKKKKYSVSITIPREKIDLDQDRSNEVTFRVRSAKISADLALPGYHIYVALPMEKLEEEIIEVILLISLGLLFSTIMLILINYFLAGRILRPVRQITNLAQEINENDLTRRIPLNSSQDELYHLSFALNQMLDRLQYSFTRQKQFLADAAHELNTPMTSVQLFMEQGLLNQELPAPFYKDLQQQQQVLMRIKRLLHDLMTLSWLELGRKLKPETFDLKAITASVIEDFKPLINAKNIDLTSSMPERLNYFGDSAQLHRVLVNVIDNAIKYNFESGKLIVTLENMPETVRLIITNSGSPIPKEELGQVFEQFYRVEKSRSQEFGGCGLGLTIVREIVNLHGGQVSLNNEPPDKISLSIILPHSFKKSA
ncbi:MAG: HAMP domain-containing protein [Deltaproteobacteria bacterium]|nr:HAMP domain-containing protein [Candidatus Tharpella sp.]